MSMLQSPISCCRSLSLYPRLIADQENGIAKLPRGQDAPGNIRMRSPVGAHRVLLQCAFALHSPFARDG